MKTYTVGDVDILHNGTLYPAGSIIELSDDDAEHLGRRIVPCFSEYRPSGPDVAAGEATGADNRDHSVKRNKTATNERAS